VKFGENSTLVKEWKMH